MTARTHPICRKIFQSILETAQGHKDYDLNYLAYADFLLDHGDAREVAQANLIHISIRLNNLVLPPGERLLLNKERALIQNQVLIDVVGFQASDLYTPAAKFISFEKNGLIRDLALGVHDMSIVPLPSGFSLTGNLYVNGAQDYTLPNNLTVGGSLTLTHALLPRLPSGLYVHNDLHMLTPFLSLQAIPTDLVLRGKLNVPPRFLSNELVLDLAKVDGVSTMARANCLRSAGFDQLARQLERPSTGTDRGPG